ncbi:MAG: hypothetical protein ACFFCW_20210 [Candidatus Hodarchaeota archaeon]
MSKKRTIENPFPGLRPFEPHESYLFFGREGQSQELLCRLRKNQFLAVVGISGSGKSSLVRAGLLPALHGGFMVDAGSHWRIVILRPGANPIGNLAQELSKPGVLTEARSTDKSDDPAIQAAITESTLCRSDSGLVEAIKQSVISKDENLLIVVDQFEELFRFKASAGTKDAHNEAAAFVKLLLKATTQKDVPVYVVITMRSDFLGECAQFRDLPETINKSQYLIPRMTRDQRREAITGPIAVGGAQITTRLVQRLLNDVSDDPDQLPILQHALMRTWDYWLKERKASEPIDLNHYENIGGMDGAMSSHADEAYNELSDNHSKKIAEILFKCLTEKGPDNREIRRSTKVQEICEVAQVEKQEVVRVIENFRRQGRSFLMPPPDVELEKEPMIDISHESLIRNWDRLKKWVDEETQSAQIYRRLAETAVLYKEGRASLWRNPDLQLAMYWKEQNKPNHAWAKRYHPEFDCTIDFLDKSRKKYRIERITRLLLIPFILVFIVILFLSVLAIMQRNEALNQRASARASAQEAKENEMLARRAAKKDSISRIEAEIARAEADSLRRLAQKEANIAMKNEARAIAAAKADSISRTRVETLSYGHLARVLARLVSQQLQLGEYERAALLARQAYIFNRRYEGERFNQEVYDALRTALDEPQILQSHAEKVRTIVISTNGETIASGSADGTICIWNIHQSNLKAEEVPYAVLRGHVAGVRSLALSLDGHILASGSDDKTVRLWNIKEPNSKSVVLKEHKNRVWAVAFDSKGKTLASGGADSTVRIWKIDRRNTNFICELKHKSWVRAITFSQDGSWLASGTEDGTVWLWDLKRNGKAVNTLVGHKGRVNTLTYSPDGLTLASGSEDKTIRLWNMSKPNSQPKVLVGHNSGVTSVKFSSDGRMLASGSYDNEVRIWDWRQTDSGNTLVLKHSSWVLSVAFSSDSQVLASGCRDKNIYIWPTQASLLAEKICNKVQRNLSMNEWNEFVGSEITYELTCPELPVGKGIILDVPVPNDKKLDKQMEN